MVNVSSGIQLMLIGMTTVFVILTIVIYGSRLLIAVINRLPSKTTDKPQEDSGSDNSHISILEAAVSQITSGTGKIVKITEI